MNRQYLFPIHRLISRRSPRAICSLLILALLLLTGPNALFADSATVGARPNVIWICLDAARAHNLSCYGYERPTTPNIDALAARGTLMEWNFSQAMWTVLSVPSYLTGRYFPVLVHEPVVGKELERKPAKDERLFSEVMADNGYKTVLVSGHAWFTPRSRICESFAEKRIVKPATSSGLPYATFEQLNEEVYKWLAANKDAPFFIYLHTMDTHFPHIVEPPYTRWVDPEYRSDQMSLGRPTHRTKWTFSSEDREHLRGLYDGSLLYADTYLGHLMERLDGMGLTDNTIIIINADHGDMLGEDGSSWGHKAWTYDWLMRVPLIMAGPGIPSGVRVPALTQNVDIVPTLVDVLDLSSSAGTDGVSLQPLLDDPEGPELHDYAFAKLGSYDGPHLYVLRNRELKYECNPSEGWTRMYSAPDTTLPRKEIGADHPDQLALASDYVRREILPRYEAYTQLPTLAFYFSLFQLMASAAEPEDAFIVEDTGVNRASEEDGKWSYSRQTQCLWVSYREKAPELRLHLELPNGHYLAQIEVLSSSSFYKSKPASALLAKAEQDSDFRRLEEKTRPSADWAYEFTTIGEYDVLDGAFDVTLEQADAEHWAVIRRFRFIPVDEVPEEEKQQVMDQLKGLGYL